MPPVSSMLLARGFTALASVHGETVTIVSTGETFTAVILTEQNVVVETESGQDLREQVKLHVARGVCPDTLAAVGANRGVQIRDSSGNVYRANSRTDNPSDQTLDFNLTKIVDGVDT